MSSFIVRQFAVRTTPPNYSAVVALALLLTLVVVALDAYQGYAQRQWDARKARWQARNQAINMHRTEPTIWAPEPLPMPMRDSTRRRLRIRLVRQPRREVA